MTAKGADTTPSPTQSAVPPGESAYRGALTQDWAVSMLMEMQKSMGKTEHALDTIANDLRELKGKAGRVEKIMYAAGVILVICLAVGGWLVNTAKDFAMMNYKASLEAPRPTVPAPTPPTPVSPPVKPPLTAPVR